MPEAPPAGETPQDSAARAAAEERARRLEVEFLEGVRARLPEHPAVVESLAPELIQLGRFVDAWSAADTQAALRALLARISKAG